MSTGTSAWAPPTGGVPSQPAPPHNAAPYGWNPPPTGGAPGPVQQGAPRPPKMWLWALVTSILMVVAIAATAAITYAIAHSTSDTSASAPAAPSAPTFTAAEQAAAKQSVCQTFDKSTAGQKAQGGVVVDGQPNVPVLLRKITGAVSIIQALVPATPDSVATPARQYVAANLSLMNASLGQGSLDEIKQLTAATNDATGTLADACGLPR